MSCLFAGVLAVMTAAWAVLELAVPSRRLDALIAEQRDRDGGAS